MSLFPIGSMGLVYLPILIYHKIQAFLKVKYTVRPMDPMDPGIPQNVWNLEESGHSKLKLHLEMSETEIVPMLKVAR